MTTTDDLLPQLQALLARWDSLAAASAGKLQSADNPVQGGFYSGK